MSENEMKMPKIKLVNIVKHFCTITRHRLLVCKHCFKIGLYWQGLTHDLSKFSPVEFSAGARYYQGNRSPIDREKEVKGYSLGWLHHKGRNKHHYEYWIDYSLEGPNLLAGMKMPVKYVVEMFLDRIAASKVYLGDAYTSDAPLAYYENGRADELMHKDTRELLEKLLHMLAEEGEETTYRYIRREVLKR